MRRLWAFVVFFVLSSNGLSNVCADFNFDNNTSEVIAHLYSPSFKDIVNFTMPFDYYVSNATLLVNGLSIEPASSDFPESVAIQINGTTIWAFQGKGFGPLGRQNRFFNDNKSAFLQLSSNGGNQQTWIRLPWNATVQNATMMLTGRAPSKGTRIAIFPGEAAGDHCGNVAGAGDVNNDGYDDVIVGASKNDAGGSDAGRAYIFFGGNDMDNVSDVVITGSTPNQGFGTVLSGAGDINDDGYDDVIITDRGNSAKAWIYYGGQNMDNIADITLTKPSGGNSFGFSASCAGDVNGDGYDDVIVGACGANLSGVETGAAYVYFGDQNMDTTPDAIFLGEGYKDFFGDSVARAGDFNGDGYGDVIVGAPNNQTAGNWSGSAYIFFGGEKMDNSSDIVFRSTQKNENFGWVVSTAGDVNDDGFDDVIISAENNNTGGAGNGQARLFFGGKSMDNISDLVFMGNGGGGLFGNGCSGAGDVNGDGYSDIVVGEPENNTPYKGAGCVYLFVGNKSMDNSPDMRFLGGALNENLGKSVAGAGDVNDDGFDEVILGSYWGDANGVESGYAILYNCILTPPELRDPEMKLGNKTIWNQTGYFNGSVSIPEFSKTLNDYLHSSPVYSTDSFGNCYVDIPIVVKAENEGNFTLSMLEIDYTYTAVVSDFSSVLNNYLDGHRKENDSNGKITVPLMISASTAGCIKLSALDITRDMPPITVKQIPDKDLGEDSAIVAFLDLHQYFQDDSCPAGNLTYSIVSATNSSLVRLWMTVNRYLSVDALTGDVNDNWTGTVEAVVACTDPWGQRTESNRFTIFIKNVNDPPLITSTPSAKGNLGETYYYNLTAVDGDNDPLLFGLETAPSGMEIDPALGKMIWTPLEGGVYQVNATVSDGNSTANQIFNITVPYGNRPPGIKNTTIPVATVGVPYSFTIPAADPDGDRLSFTLMNPTGNMNVNSSTGILGWTPEKAGTCPVSVKVSDGQLEIMFDFSITVNEPGLINNPPTFTSKPVITAFAGIRYSYAARATDPDKDELSYSLIENPPGLTIDKSTGRITWTPVNPGNFVVKIKVSDGKGGEAMQNFTVSVAERVKPRVEFSKPYEGEKVKGKVTVGGTIFKGTLDIVKVQVRVDSGAWVDAAGNSTWTYVLDTTKIENGNHNIQARAFDGLDYSDVVNRTVSVDNRQPAVKGAIPAFTAPLVVMGLMISLIVNRSRKRKPSE